MSALIVDDPEPPSAAGGALFLSISEGTALGLLLAGALLLCFVCALVRYGLDAFSRARLIQTVTENEDRERLESLLSDLDRTRIAATLLWVTSESCFVLLLLRLAARLLGADSVLEPIVLAIGLPVSAVLQVALCRLLPRLLVNQRPESMIAPVLPWIRVVGVALSPLVLPLGAWQKALSRMLGVRSGSSLDEAFSEELRAKVAEGERDGVVAEDEAEMIENVVEFRDVEVSEVMTPRTDVDWVDADASVLDAARIAAEKSHSRLPVGEGDSDHMIGVFYVRDVIGRIDQLEELRDLKVRDFCRKPFFVPESRSIHSVLQEMRESKVHIAIVLDEYGGTAGIVTIEDILEEIVGEIDDEYDEKSAPALELKDADHCEADARTRIDEVNDALGIHLPESDDFDTIGGLVFSRLGYVPTVGETLELDGVQFRVLDADARRVRRLGLTVLSRGNGSNGTNGSR